MYKQAKKQRTGGNTKKVEGDSWARVVRSIILGLYTFRVSVRYIREMFSDNRRRRASKESTRLYLKNTIGPEGEEGSPRIKEKIETRREENFTGIYLKSQNSDAVACKGPTRNMPAVTGKIVVTVKNWRTSMLNACRPTLERIAALLFPEWN